MIERLGLVEIDHTKSIKTDPAIDQEIGKDIEKDLVKDRRTDLEIGDDIEADLEIDPVIEKTGIV